MAPADPVIIVAPTAVGAQLAELAKASGINALVVGTLEEARVRLGGASAADDRRPLEREALRRRRAECLANLGLEAEIVKPAFENLDHTAQVIARAVRGSAAIFLEEPFTGRLLVAGFASNAENADDFSRYREYVAASPFHSGEGLPGTVFETGRALLFSELRGSVLLEFARDEADRQLMAALRQTTLVAAPVEAYGERVGAIVISRSDASRVFELDDLEFAESVGERIATAHRIQRLTRFAMEGHRAAEEIARHEVDARLRFEAVLERAPIGIAVISTDELRFELANLRWMEFASRFGRINAEEKIIGLRVDEVIPDFEGELREVAEKGGTRTDEAIEVPDGDRTIFVNRIISAVGGFTGETQSLTVLVQDVTEQVRATHQIETLAKLSAERTARLDSILHSMTDALWVYGHDGAVIDVNTGALTLFGLGSRTEAIAHGSLSTMTLRYPDGKTIPEDDYPQARALRGEVVPDYLAIGRHVISGRDVDLSIAAAPIESGGIVGAVLVMRDISAIQELDRKKDEFLSVASHELRTPLTTIKGYTQLLQQTLNDLTVTERETYLAAVIGEIDRMMNLITELLDVSRIETKQLKIHPMPVRWKDFLERRAAAFRVQHPERTIHLDCRIDREELSVDHDRMRQVIDNLLSNAVKYSPDGSGIDVRVHVRDRSMITEVIDHGIGIPADELPRLFDRFHRARNVSSRYYGGLGLGLYIAHAIVEAHGGAISVESSEGGGSCFTLALPLP